VRNDLVRRPEKYVVSDFSINGLVVPLIGSAVFCASTLAIAYFKPDLSGTIGRLDKNLWLTYSIASLFGLIFIVYLSAAVAFAKTRGVSIYIEGENLRFVTPFGVRTVDLNSISKFYAATANAVYFETTSGKTFGIFCGMSDRPKESIAKILNEHLGSASQV